MERGNMRQSLLMDPESELSALAGSKTKLPDEPLSPALSPKLPVHDTLHSELYSLDWQSLRAHPSFYSEFMENRSTTVSSAIFNLVSTIIGGGVLSLPYAIHRAGVVATLVMLVISGLACDWSVYILISCSRRTGALSYKAVAEAAYGRSAGLLVTTLLVALVFLVIVAYSILLRDIMTPLAVRAGIVHEDMSKTAESAVMCVSVLAVAPLCLFRSMHALRFTSAVSLVAVAVLGASLLYHLISGDVTPPEHSLRSSVKWWPLSYEDVMYVFPVVAITYLCHFNVLPIHCDLIVPSRARIKRVIHGTVGVCSALYITIGLIGYLIFFDTTKGNILNNFSADDTAITVGRVGLGVAVLLSYPLLVLPCRDCLLELLNPIIGRCLPAQPQLALLGPAVETDTRSEALKRVVVVCVVVGSSLAIATQVRTVVTVWNFMGSTIGLLISFVLPPLFYLKIRRPSFKSSMTLPAWALLVCGAVSMVLCTAEAVRSAQ